MFPPGARVLVALSGGPDSVALLHILRALEREGELIVAGIGHFNHQLRGAEADADEQFCRETAVRAGLRIEVGRADVRALARRARRSIEDAARSARYAFLAEAATRTAAGVIAVGHSLEDQAETVVLRLLRGAGTRGLGAIRPRAGNIVRPLLEIRRDELRRYAADHGLEYRDDSTNRDLTIARNRVRHELIPILQRYSPGIVSILARQAESARQDEEYLASAAIESAGSVVLTTERGVAIDASRLVRLPAALASRVVRQALAANAPGRFIGFEHIQRVIDLARCAKGSVSLPGQLVTRSGDHLLLEKAPVRPFSNFFRLPLSIPGEVVLEGWTVSARPIDSAVDLWPPTARGPEVLVLAERLRQPLAVRNRRPGDRFYPLGLGGRGRKLQDFLVDRKVPRHERDRLPLVVDCDDRIVWVAGQSVAEDFRVTAPSQGVILLKASRLGGAG